MEEGNIARLLAGQDPDELAAKVAVHGHTARRWLNGEALPYRRILKTISAATGIPVEELRIAHRADRATRREARV